MDALAPFYGTDWIGMVLSFACLYRLGGQRRDGFLYGAASNVAWAVFSVFAGSVPTLGANIAFCLLNLRGWFRWKALPAPPAAPSGG
jgi:hypothetical protein